MQREYPGMPLIGVGAVIVAAGRVLLIRRATEPMKGRWSIPGGLVELGETLDEAVRRECLEETGVRVEPVALIELLDRIYREEACIRYHFVIADYLCRITGGQAVAGSDASAVRWVEREEWAGPANLAPGGLNLDPFTARIIEAGWQRAQQSESK